MTRLVLAITLLMATAAPAAANTLLHEVDAGLPDTTTWGASVTDYDGDGRPDIFLNTHTRRPALYRGGAGEVTMDWPHPMDRHQCAWGEADGDGRPDLFCSQGLPRPDSDNELWLNTPGGLINRAGDFGLARGPARARTATWIDYDRDGDLDVFLGSHEQPGVGDMMLRNDRGTFTEVTVGVEGERNTNRATWADWNRDGWPDLLLTIAEGKAIAFENRQGTFTRIEIPGVTTRGWFGTAWGDYNGDGWPDLALVTGGRVDIMRNDRGTFRLARSVALKRGVSAVWVDLNNNGRLDLYVVQRAPGWDPGPEGDAPDLLLIQTKTATFNIVRPPELAGWSGSGDSAVVLDHNGDLRMDVLVTNGDRRWSGQARLLENRMAVRRAAAVRLIGPAWNPLGFGATVQVKTPKFTYQRQLNNGMAWHGQSDVSYVHLGLRKRAAGQVTVTWPDGRRDCVKVAAGKVTTLRIGTRPCA